MQQGQHKGQHQERQHQGQHKVYHQNNINTMGCDLIVISLVTILMEFDSD